MRIFCWLSLVGCVAGLFEDQVFKFDWRRQYIGKINDLSFFGGERGDMDPILVVGTQRNVVAALDSDNGRILWRHKFEEDPAVGGLRRVAVAGKHVASVSGLTNLYLRLWEPTKGALVAEHFVRVKEVPSLIHVIKSKMYTINIKNNKVEVNTFGFDTKRLDESNTAVLTSPGGVVEKCAVGEANILTCLTAQGLVHTSLKGITSGTTLELISFEDKVSPETMTMSGSFLQVESGTGLLTFKVAPEGVVRVSEAKALLSVCPGLGVEQECLENGISADGVEYCTRRANSVKLVFNGQELVVKLAEDRGRLERVWSECSDDPEAYQLILAFEDGSLVAVTPRGNVMFIREEGLAKIQNAEMVGMGFQDTNFQVRLFSNDNMFDPTTLAQNFINRLKRHVSYLQNFVVSLASLQLTAKAKQITPDRFGLNKVIVAVTKHNKMYGIESISGEILWQRMFPGEFNDDLPAYQPQTYLLIQKDGRSGDYAQATLVYKHARSVHYMMTFDPLNGAIVSNEPINLRLDQALLLPEQADHELRPILLIGKDGSAAIHPTNAITCLQQGPRLFVAAKSDTGRLEGKRVVVTDSNEILLTPVWSLTSPNTEILEVKTRNTVERIHSAGRVLADRSVLFKYMNPNLALVVAKGTDSAAKIFINVYLLDLVTGRIFYSASHKKVLPPFHTVNSENWAVYSFFNDKARRTELVSLELYEGKTQTNASVFSSIDNTVSPLVERQAYILPASDITAMQETITEQGIASKHLLIGTAAGSVIDLPLHMVDPRRSPLNAPPHLREPGIPPYIPELAIPHESIANYNQSLLGVREIVSSPSGLESTTLVFVHGLDLYGTRLTPSKGFDMIKEDFDYLMITSVILGLAVASYVSRKFSQKKMLAQAWK